MNVFTIPSVWGPLWLFRLFTRPQLALRPARLTLAARWSFMRVFFWRHIPMNQEDLTAAVLRMGEHPRVVVLRRKRSRFTRVTQSILCWRGVAKQPQGTEWDLNSGDLEPPQAHWSFLSLPLSCDASLCHLHDHQWCWDVFVDCGIRTLKWTSRPWVHRFITCCKSKTSFYIHPFPIRRTFSCLLSLLYGKKNPIISGF